MPLPKPIPFEPEIKVINDLSGGVDYSTPSGKLPENKFTDALNVQLLQGLLRVDSGYIQYRQAVLGTPQAAFQFIEQNGALQTLLLTTATMYLDNGLEWQYISDGIINTTLTAQTVTGLSTFTVASTANLNVGDKIGIGLNDSTQLRTTVKAIAGNNVTTADAVPASKAALAGAGVVRPPAFNGSLAFQPVEVQWPTLNSLILTNGVDPIQIWNGATCVPLPGWNNITARVLVAFHGFLLAFDTTEGGTRFPQRKRWSDQNNPENTTTGLSGFVDLTDTEDFILAALELGPWLIIYRQASVMRSSYIGDPLLLFFDEYMLQGVGIWSQQSVADTGSTHIFAGQSGIFRYSGGYDVEDVGEPVFEQLYGPKGIANLSQTQITTCFYISELDEVWVMIATGANQYLDSVFRLDQGRGAWWPRKFGNQFIGFGFLTGIAGRSWQQATIPWNQDTTTWISHSKQPLAPVFLFCDPVNNQTWLYDFLSTKDGGSTIPWKIETKDFEVQQMQIRTDGFYAKGTGNNILLEISFDRGLTWLAIGTLNFGLTFTKQQLNFQFVADVCRLRLSGIDPLSSIDWYRFDYFPESLW